MMSWHPAIIAALSGFFSIATGASGTGLAVMLAGTAPCFAQEASRQPDLVGTTWQTAAEQGNAQAWERALGLTDEFLVQLALAKGLDPVRAEALRDIYQERRQWRRKHIGEAAAGRITRQELRLASASDEARLGERIEVLLTAEEILALDAHEARMYAVEILQRLDSRAR